ncbi:MAG TPA: FUSC family protein [Bryobacteraceae bacterium]|nr:FUSC family protein [Bryobacteraceae bacterium]
MSSPGVLNAPAAQARRQVNAWTAFWRSVVRFQAEKVAPWLALRNTLGVALPLAAGVATGNVSSGLVVGTGALNVAFSDSDEPYAQRAQRMLASSALVGLAVFAGSVTGASPPIAVAVVAAWAFAAGMMVALSTTAADLGTISLVTLVVFGAVPQAPERALFAGLLAFGGGLLQALLAVIAWPLGRYVLERRVLGELYLELARAAALPVQVMQAPPASAQTTQAQQRLAALDRNHSIESERYRMLLSQAERIQLSLLALGRLRLRMERENPAKGAAGIMQRYFEVSERVLAAIGNSLAAGEAARAGGEYLEELDTLSEALREGPADSGLMAALQSDARLQMDALAGQLRAALDLAAHATPTGVVAFRRSEARQPWGLRLGGTLATLRANLSLRSAACRHAIRLSVCVAAGDAVARGLGLRRSYWLPMTIAIVLKPDFTATFTRGVLRLIGTFAGLMMATALFHVLPPGLGPQVALIAIYMFVMRCFGGANYEILVAAVTALVVLLIALTGVSPKEVMAARALNSAAGGAIALVAYWLWPTWERTQVAEAMAQMLDAYRDYFRAIKESYIHADTQLSAELDRARAAARLARSNLEASIDRLSAEPGTSAETLKLLGGILASSHRLVHGMMALEAGLLSSHPAPAREPFRRFANDVELTLYYLAAALRGSPIDAAGLPNLREDHNALVHSGEALNDRYALVNVETDRVTNSLNTLSGELLRWLGVGDENMAVPRGGGARELSG